MIFFLSHNGTDSFSVEPILRIAGISSKYKQKRLTSISNQHRKMSSQQSRAIRSLHANPAVGQCYCQYDNTIAKEGLQCFLQLLLWSVICGSAKTREQSIVSDMGGENVFSYCSFFEKVKMKEEIKIEIRIKQRLRKNQSFGRVPSKKIEPFIRKWWPALPVLYTGHINYCL